MSKGLSEAGRLRELEFRVEALEKKAKERERVENEILENARQWRQDPEGWSARQTQN
jgi:hypothetical protein